MQETARRVGIRLELLTVGWNAIEAAVAIAAGVAAGSVALVAFGLDSVVEVSAALVVLWQFFGEVPEDRERRALRLIGGCFFGLAAYVTLSSSVDLATRSEPDASTVGIVLTAVSLVVMPALAWAKRNAGRRMGSRSRRGLDPNSTVRVPVCQHACRTRGERRVRLVVGGPARRARHRRGRHPGRPPSMEGR